MRFYVSLGTRPSSSVCKGLVPRLTVELFKASLYRVKGVAAAEGVRYSNGLKYVHDRQTSTTKASFLAFHHLQYGISGLVDCYQLTGEVLFPLTCGITSSVSQIFHVHAAALSESRVWPLLLKTIGMQQSVIRLLATSSIDLGTQESAS